MNKKILSAVLFFLIVILVSGCSKGDCEVYDEVIAVETKIMPAWGVDDIYYEYTFKKGNKEIKYSYERYYIGEGVCLKYK